MARRVNTKFVIMLGVVLAVVGGGGVGLMAYRYIKRSDPVALRQRAETAETAGDLKMASEYFGLAAEAASRRHALDADTLYAHMARVSMLVAKNAKTQEDAIVYYQRAMAGYSRALAENPRNTAVNEILLDMQYQVSRGAGQRALAAWNALEDVATRMIENSDAVKPRVYRAEARLMRASGARDPSEEDFARVEADLQAALAMDPNSGHATALSALMLWNRAAAAMSRRGIPVQEWLKSETIPAAIEEAYKRLDAHMAAHGVDADVAAAAADLSLKEYQLDRSRSDRLDRAIALLEKALDADPDRTQLGDVLGMLYAETSPAKTEALFKRMIERNPESPEGYYRLAEFHRRRNSSSQAIEAYLEVLKHPQIGSGPDAIRNELYQIRAADGIAWLSLDMAEREGVSSDKGNAAMQMAAEYTETLRNRAHRGMVGLLDGRIQLLNRNVTQAMTTLRDAERVLNGVDGMQDKLRYARIYLAEANRQQNQFGAALDLLGQALETESQTIPPDLVVGLIRTRAQLLVQVGRATEAMTEISRLLGEQVMVDSEFQGEFRKEGQLPDTLRVQCKRVWAAAAGAMGRKDWEQAVLRRLDLGGDDAAVTLQLAQSNYDVQEFVAALENATRLTGRAGLREQTAMQAYQIAVMSQSQLGNTDEARRMADEALAKYPQNPLAQQLAAQSRTPDGGISPESQLRIIEAYTDDLLRYWNLAGFHERQGQYDKQVEALQAAAKIIAESDTPESHEQMARLIERAFNASLIGAVDATQKAQSQTDAAQQAEFRRRADAMWASAQAYAGQAEKLNLDGVEGKLFRGRLEMAQTDGRSGLQLLEQVVAQRPEYAAGHLALAQAYAARKNTTGALEEFRQVLRIAPSNLGALQAAIPLLLNRGDSVSLRQAQDLVQTALRISPRNSVFVRYGDLILDDVQGAIRRREELLRQQPNDSANRRLLASLYLRATPPNPGKAIDLIRPEYEKNRDDLVITNLLAQLYVEDKRPQDGLNLFVPFLSSTDEKVKFQALIYVAEFHRKLMDFVKAETALRDAIRIAPPDSDDAQRHLADLLFDQGKMAEAEKLYTEVTSRGTGEERRELVLRRLIETQIRQDDPVKHAAARRELDALLARTPDDTQSRILRAYLSIREQKLDAALADLNPLLPADAAIPNPDALYYRGMALLMLSNRHVEAERDLVAAAKSPRQAIGARLLLARHYSMIPERYAQAVVVYGEILALEPELYQARVEYSDYLMRLSEEHMRLSRTSEDNLAVMLRQLDPMDKLFRLLRESDARYPEGDPRWRLMYADLLLLRGNIEDAKVWYAAVWAKYSGEAQVNDAYIQVLLKTRDYQEAAKLASDIIERNPQFIVNNPKYVEFYLHRAVANQGLGRQAEVPDDVDRALAIAVDAARQKQDYLPFLATLTHASRSLPADLAVQRLRVRLEKDAGDFLSRIGLIQILLLDGKGQEALTVADAMTIPDHPVERHLGLRLRAAARYEGERYEAARKDYEDALAIVPEDVECLNNLAYLLAEHLNSPSAGVELAERALGVLETRSNISQVSANRANVLDTLGWAYFRYDRNEEAIRHLRRSLDYRPMAAAYQHLAEALTKARNLIEAQQMIEEGLLLATRAEDTKVQQALKSLQAKLPAEYVALTERLRAENKGMDARRTAENGVALAGRLGDAEAERRLRSLLALLDGN